MTAGEEPRTYTISAKRNSLAYWPDLFRSWALILRLAKKEILIRHRQTVIGMGWVLARPLLTMIALVLIFGKLANLSSEGVPYPVFVFAALVPWQLAMTALNAVSMSVIGNANLIGKVYFPRLIIPLSSMGPSLLDFAISAVLFAIIAGWYGVGVGIQILLCPVFIVLTVALVLGVGLWFAACSARYRDVSQGLPFVIQFGMYISPVGYGTHLVPDAYKPIYMLNPMVGMLDGFRWTVLGIDPYWPAIYYSIAFAVLALISGIWFFRRQERTFADVI